MYFIFLLICVFATVFLIIGGSATYPSSDIIDPSFSPIDSVYGVFALIAGMAVILNSSDKVPREGPLRRLFGQTSNAIVIQPLFQTLINQVTETKFHLSDYKLGLSEEDRTGTINAIDALVESAAQEELRNSFGTPAEVRAALRRQYRLVIDSGCLFGTVNLRLWLSSHTTPSS